MRYVCIGMGEQALGRAARPDALGTSRVLSPRLAVIGAVGGLLSGLLGVGGGIVMVPLLTLWAGFSQRIAHAMSLTAIVPIAIAGVATYGGAGRIDVAQAAALTVGSMAGARSGARLLARADDRTLKVGFGAVLLAVAAAMAVHP